MLNYSQSSKNKAAAALELRRRRRLLAAIKPLTFSQWLPEISPAMNWEWPHLQYVQTHLQMVTDGKIKKLAIFMPPRHGKSECVTVRYPVYRMERNPEMNVIVGAYNQTFTNRFSRKSRKIARVRFALDPEREAVEEWVTDEGGTYRSVGVGGGVTGQGGHLIIIDDPVKSREEANSAVYRDRVWAWYTEDLYTRLEPKGAIILIMTRWHEDDLAGRILASPDGPNWTIINLPAEAEDNDQLGRRKGEALCPDRFDLAALLDIKTVLGNGYNALYQQRPQAIEGGMFKRQKFQFVDEIPASAKRVRWWDFAATADDGDYAAGVLMAMSNDGRYFVEDVQRGQWSSHERDGIIKATAELDASMYGNTVEVWREQEPGSSGVDAAKAFVKMLAGFPAKYQTSTGSKEVRADPFSAQVAAENVYLKRAPWNAAYIAELSVFPTGRNDDQVDASSGAFNKLARSNDTIGHTRISKSSLFGRNK